MDKTLLSIIMPCYNGYSFITKALGDFEKLNSNDIEVIVVDDCSTDNSYQNLLEYKDNSSLNLTVVQNEVNSGPGVSRNNGVKLARGKYITFLDADDFFAQEFLEKLSPLMELDYDCIVYDGSLYYEEGKTAYYSLLPDRFIEGEIDVKETLVFIAGGTLGKAYKRQIIIDNNVQFLAQNRCEDIPFTKHAISCCEKIYYLKSQIYMYVQRTGSLMHNSSLTNPLNATRAFKYIEKNINDKYAEEIEALFITDFLYTTVLQQAKILKRKELIRYIKELEMLYPNYYSNKYFAFTSKRIRTVVKYIKKKRYCTIKFMLFAQKIFQKIKYKI